MGSAMSDVFFIHVDDRSPVEQRIQEQLLLDRMKPELCMVGNQTNPHWPRMGSRNALGSLAVIAAVAGLLGGQDDRVQREAHDPDQIPSPSDLRSEEIARQMREDRARKKRENWLKRQPKK